MSDSGGTWVEVAVALPVPGTFHYRAAPGLRGVGVGSRVLVPFGPRAVSGVVVRMGEPPQQEVARVLDVRELLDPTPALPPEVWSTLAETKPGHGGEIQLTDALQQLARSKAGLYGVPVRGVRHDAGDKLGYLRASLAYALKRGEMREPLLDLLQEVLKEHGR